MGAEGLEPRPSPCKGETNAQVRALTSVNVVPSGPSAYLRVLSSCYAVVMHEGPWVVNMAPLTCHGTVSGRC
jgi:hypothetical protein